MTRAFLLTLRFEAVRIVATLALAFNSGPKHDGVQLNSGVASDLVICNDKDISIIHSALRFAGCRFCLIFPGRIGIEFGADLADLVHQARLLAVVLMAIKALGSPWVCLLFGRCLLYRAAFGNSWHHLRNSLTKWYTLHVLQKVCGLHGPLCLCSQIRHMGLPRREFRECWAEMLFCNFLYNFGYLCWIIGQFWQGQVPATQESQDHERMG